MKSYKSLVVILLLFFSTAISADGDGGPSNSLNYNWDEIGKVLTVFLLFSIVFETAMTPLFNWRIFIRYFHARGVKTPLTVILAYLVFSSYKLNIMQQLLQSMGHEASDNFFGRLITALLIAGGSDGIFKIFTKLGIRNPAERDEKAKAERDKKENAEGATSGGGG